MFGKRHAIKKFLVMLPSGLEKRYGEQRTYTQKQVDATVYELGISRKHIQFAYLMCCDQKDLIDREYLDLESAEQMNKLIDNTACGGIVGSFVLGALGGNTGAGEDGDGGGGGE